MFSLLEFCNLQINTEAQIIFPYFFQVSWVRYRDVSLIAVGKFIYIADDRFKVFILTCLGLSLAFYVTTYQ